VKRKSLFVRGETLLKWHAVIYISFIVLLWAALAAALFDDPSDSVFALNKGLIVTRVEATIFWGLFFLAHFAVHQIQLWSQNRNRQFHLNNIHRMQEQYRTESRLDINFEAEDENLIDETEWSHQQRLQSK
jgi:hypothetical protein